MISLSVRVVSFKNESFKGRGGDMVNWQVAVIRIGDNLVKVTSKVDMTAYVDKEAKVTIEVAADRNMNPKLRIVEVAAAGK